MKILVFIIVLTLNICCVGSDRFTTRSGRYNGHTSKSGSRTNFYNSSGRFQGSTINGNVLNKSGQRIGGYSGKPSNTIIKGKYFPD